MREVKPRGRKLRPQSGYPELVWDRCKHTLGEVGLPRARWVSGGCPGHAVWVGGTQGMLCEWGVLRACWVSGRCPGHAGWVEGACYVSGGCPGHAGWGGCSGHTGWGGSIQGMLCEWGLPRACYVSEGCPGHAMWVGDAQGTLGEWGGAKCIQVSGYLFSGNYGKSYNNPILKLLVFCFQLFLYFLIFLNFWDFNLATAFLSYLLSSHQAFSRASPCSPSDSWPPSLWIIIICINF